MLFCTPGGNDAQGLEPPGRVGLVFDPDRRAKHLPGGMRFEYLVHLCPPALLQGVVRLLLVLLCYECAFETQVQRLNCK
jgi:hypothetical protein